MSSILSSAKMFCAGILQRRLSVGLTQKLGWTPKKLYSEEKKPPSVFLWGGGLGKLQGGLKEEEYFISLTQNLMDKMRDKKDHGDYLPNWDEFQKTLDHASLGSTTSMNKHKNLLEEAFFLNETADDFKVLHDRAQEDPKDLKNATELEHKSNPQNTK
ncbi:uncharacterized protein LOC6531810 [Drosophila yakuba]|uniref:Uncharacterized protein n=1 Tax=Drosophila yakuba TaxID=7245 RepID=B4P969_DROYA|nr:uncharacterized protein LOC6531810 [Drosophila yakuba]EDW92309.1 uncharacterized protein Dyak_GE14280 [Drosophila yakuba]